MTESQRIAEDLERGERRDREWLPRTHDGYGASVMATKEEIEAERVRKKRITKRCESRASRDLGDSTN